MADVLGNALDWLEGKRHAHMTRTVTYRRGQDSIPISATKGNTPREGADAEGFSIQAEITDWLIRASDLVLQDEQVEPEAGDRIEETLGGRVQIYEVRPIAPAQPVFRWSDPNRNTLRIHTKEGSVEEVE